MTIASIAPLPVELLDFERVKNICLELKKAESSSPSIFIRKFDLNKALVMIENREGYALIKAILRTFGGLMYAHIIYGDIPAEETLEHLLTHLQGLPDPPDNL